MSFLMASSPGFPRRSPSRWEAAAHAHHPLAGILDQLVNGLEQRRGWGRVILGALRDRQVLRHRLVLSRCGWPSTRPLTTNEQVGYRHAAPVDQANSTAFDTVLSDTSRSARPPALRTRTNGRAVSPPRNSVGCGESGCADVG